MKHPSTLVIGAGPAGLTAAYELARNGRPPLVVEASPFVGGIARTECYKGYRFDIGGHRFFTKVEEVEALWHEVLGDEMIAVPRLSRIYYNGKFFNYPLSLANVVGGLGVVESFLIFCSYLKARARPLPSEDSFEEWVVNRFGDRLYRTFFKTYTEKVWGMPCSQIRADWAAQRIKGLSFASAVKNALFGGSEVKSLISTFQYPRLGPGQMWEAFAREVGERGGEVRLQSKAARIRHDGSRVLSVELESPVGTEAVEPEQVVASMPISKLVAAMDPAAPEPVRRAAASLRYRDFLIVCLVLDKEGLFPDNWIYVHSPEARVGRIQNFGNWSKAMIGEEGTSCLGMEYFCNQDDDLWAMDDRDLVDLAGRELAALGLAPGAQVSDGFVIRQKKAYPVYDEHYRGHLEVIRQWLDGFENLQTIGRNGMHRYNNQDHSMLCGLYAARNLLGESHDLWEVNTERSYYEEQTLPKDGKGEGAEEERAAASAAGS